MSKDKHDMKDWLQTVAAAGSLVTAVVAIWIAFEVERRNEQRFDAQLEQSERVASASIRPLLFVHSQVYLNQKAVLLSNRGIGAAIITGVEFRRGSKTSKNVAELFEFDREVIWDDFRRFGPQSILAPGEEIVLAKLTLNGLIKQGLEKSDAESVLRQFEDQREQIDIKFEYTDLLNNPQKPETW